MPRLVSKFARIHANTIAISNRICTVPRKQAVLVQNSSVQKIVRTHVNVALRLVYTERFYRATRAAIKSQQSCTKFRACSNCGDKAAICRATNRNRLFTRAICCRRKVAVRSQLLSRDKIALCKRAFSGQKQ